MLLLLCFFRVIGLTRLPAALLELSEPLQVIRYEQGDFSHAHHDSSPAHADTACTHTRLAGNSSTLTEVSCRLASTRLWFFILVCARTYC